MFQYSSLIKTFLVYNQLSRSKVPKYIYKISTSPNLSDSCKSIIVTMLNKQLALNNNMLGKTVDHVNNMKRLFFT